MLRFKSFLSERGQQRPYTDDQINKGLGAALQNYDKQQRPYTDDQINKGLGDLLKNPKLPDNAAVAKAPNPLKGPAKPPSEDDWSGADSEKNLNIPKVQAPEMPKPFSNPSKGKMKSSMDRFDQFMKTGKSPPPTQENPKTGGSIEIPGMSGPHQATVHVPNPHTGQMDSILSPHPLHVSVHNPVTGSSLSIAPQGQQNSILQDLNKGQEKIDSGLIDRQKELARRDPGERAKAAPTPQAPQPAPQSQTPSPLLRPGEPSSLGFSQKARDLYRKAKEFETDPEAELKKMLGSKYVPPN